MQRLEVSGAVWLIYGSLGVKGLKTVTKYRIPYNVWYVLDREYRPCWVTEQLVQTKQSSYSAFIPDVPYSNLGYFTGNPHSDSRSVYGLKPNGNYMHHTFSYYLCVQFPALSIYRFFLRISEKSEIISISSKIHFVYNVEAVCFLRTEIKFIYINLLTSALKGYKQFFTEKM